MCQINYKSSRAWRRPDRAGQGAGSCRLGGFWEDRKSRLYGGSCPFQRLLEFSYLLLGCFFLDADPAFLHPHLVTPYGDVDREVMQSSP